MTASNLTDRSPRPGRDVRRSRRVRVACAAVGLTLFLAGAAAGQTPPLGGPDTPPPATEPATPSTPEPAAPATPSPAPSPAPSSPAPVSPAAPSSEPAEPSPSAAAAAARRRLQQRRRAAQARQRRREAAERRQAVRATAAVASRADTAASALSRAAAMGPPAPDAAAPGEDGRGDIVLFALLVAAALGIGLAAYSRVAGRPSTLERFRVELVGVSVACMLIVALVLAGIV